MYVLDGSYGSEGTDVCQLVCCVNLCVICHFNGSRIDTDSSSSNHHHSNKSTDPNKDNKSDESNNGNECPECGRTFKNSKGLQIHRSSKHNRKQNTLTSAGFWPCRSDKRCDICKQGKFCTSVLVQKKNRKNIKSNSQSHIN